jgi:lipopolysaccharide transport system ATP-binding protein
MNTPAIKVDSLCKRYLIGQHIGYKTFRETIVNLAKAPFHRWNGAIPTSEIRNQKSETIWALKDVSFEVEQGEVVGVIGRNGAGKSTLLKILSKITDPTKGKIELKGRIGSLLEVGTGFHPELTGHENIYLYGAILGMNRWEVTKKFDEILAFSELEKFIETPVKRYSSGMYMRLAFAVAAHLETEILLVDEVLAVGDFVFQEKCLGKMEDVSKAGKTVIFVSHNLASIGHLCESAILLENGKIGKKGPATEVIEHYLSSYEKKSLKSNLKEVRNRRGTGEVRIVEAAILDVNMKPCNSFRYGDDICFEFKLEPHKSSPNLLSVVWIRTASGIPVLHLANHDDPNCKSFKVESTVIVRCLLKNCQLLPGNYFVSLWIAPDHYRDTDFVIDALKFRMNQGELLNRAFDMSWKHGIFHSKSSWSITKLKK